MLKKLSAFILLLSFSVQSLSAQFIALDYYFNTNAYAKNCINKAKPVMHCNGKCQFMKKLQQQEKKEQENSQRNNAGKNETCLSSKSFFATINSGLLVKTVPDYPVIQNNSTVDVAISIFHPPGV